MSILTSTHKILLSKMSRKHFDY